VPIVLTEYPTEPFNTYASLAFFKTRLDNQLRSYTGKTDEQLKAALIASTEYMNVRHSYVGYMAEAGQSNQWPRREAYNVRGDIQVGIPLAVQQACCEYAWRQLNAGDLMPDPTADDTGQVIKSKSEQVGPLETSVSYETDQGVQLPCYPKADGILNAAGLVRRRGGFTVGSIARA
jgi:hypothetical protein